MNKYESVIIIKPNLSKIELEKVTLGIENKINQLAKLTNKEDIGVRKLAYEIHKNREGHYLLYQFEVNNENKENAIGEIERFYRITDEIIKYIIVKI